MGIKRERLRVDILGRIAPQSIPGRAASLTIVAEFGSNRVLEHIRVDIAMLQELDLHFSELRSFIESSYPQDYSEERLRRLGTRLFDLLFTGDVKRLFDQASGNGPQFVPLLLCVEDYRIAGWPWEYLFDGSRKHFICREFYPVCRRIFALDNRTTTRDRRRKKIKLLVVVGVPPNDGEATPDEEVKWITEVLASNLDASEFELNVVRPTDAADLQKMIRLSYKDVDVLHFFGHAAYDELTEKGFVVLKNGVESSFPADELGRLLIQSGVQLVFLNACETARSSSTSDPGQTSVAAALLSRGIPSVIGAQFSMPDVTSHYLSSTVYRSLSAGIPLIDALRDGRQAMGYCKNSKFFDWGIPVLYSFDPDLIVFRSRVKRPKQGLQRTLSEEEVAPKGKRFSQPTAFVASRRRPRRLGRPAMGVALVDIDTKAGFLPEVVNRANHAQKYFDFRVAYLPFPTTSFGCQEQMTMFTSGIEQYLAGLTTELSADVVCCLTSCKIDNGEASDLFRVTARENSRVSVLSTLGLRGYASGAGVSFSKAVFFLCLGEILAMDGRWDLPFHREMSRCLMHYRVEPADIVDGLKYMKFDHDECRKKVEDREELASIDCLLALEV
jgi:CHAT domain